MVAVFAHYKMQKHPWNHFKEVSDVVLTQFEVDSTSFGYHWENKHPLVHPRYQIAIGILDFTRRMCSEEVKETLIRRKDGGPVFWDSQGVIYINYLKKGKKVAGLYATKCCCNSTPICTKWLHMGKEKCSSTKTVQRLTEPPSSLQYLVNRPTICCPIHVISCLTRVTSFVSKLEKSLALQKFDLNEKVITTTESYFADLEK